MNFDYIDKICPVVNKPVMNKIVWNRVNVMNKLRINYKRGSIIFSMLIFFANYANTQKISPQLVGVNAWYTNPSEEVWNLTAECGMKTVRIGGHAFDDNLPSKASLLSWVKKIQAMGAEPVIQVSQYQLAADAADLVRYFNIEMSGEVNPVKYWNIGNEPWLQYNNLAPGTDVGTLVETYFKPISVAMKEVDPSIKIYGPDFCYYVEFAINDLFGGKNDIAGKIPGKDYYYCDGITWHKYPQNDNINLAYWGIDDFRTSIVKCKQKVDQVNAMHNRTCDDEWLSYLIENVSAGNYEVSFRIASDNNTSTKRIDVYIDDEYVGNVIPFYTGGWQAWETLTLEDVEIPGSDPVILKLEFKGESFNLNWIEFTKSMGASSDINRRTRDLFAWYNDQSEKISIDLNSKYDQSEVRITNLKGQLFHTSIYRNLQRTEINTTEWVSGIYLVCIRNNDECRTQKILVW